MSDVTSRELANMQRSHLYEELQKLHSIIGVDASRKLAEEIETLVRHERNDIHEMYDNAFLKIANS